MQPHSRREDGVADIASELAQFDVLVHASVVPEPFGQVVVEAIKNVAKRLGNTPSVCKKAYILPAVIDEFTANGKLEKITTETQIIAFIERTSGRDERKHLTELLRKSVRARKNTRSKAA